MIHIMFKAIKNKDVVNLIGVIHDSTNTSVVVDLISAPGITISFEKIDFFSWNGIHNLINDIKKAGQPVILTGLDPRQEEYARIAIKNHELFNFQEYKKYWYCVKDKGQKVLTVARKREDNNTLEIDYKNEHFKIADFINFVDRYDEYEDQEKELFLWAILSFVYFNCLNTSILIKSIFLGLNSKMSEIKVMVREIEKFCDKNNLSGFKLEKEFNELAKLSEISSTRLEESLTEVSKKLMAVRVLVYDVLTGKKPFKTYKSLIEKRIFSALRTLKVKVRFLESSGGAISRHLYNLKISEKAAHIFELIKSGGEDHAKIEDLKDALNVMDIMSEGDWQASLDIVEEEFKNLGNEVFNIIVLLQGFDISHQIIRNRIKDLDLFLDHVIRKDWDSQIDIKDLVRTVNQRMVSDPEMSSFEYFLCHFHEGEDSKSMDIVPGSLQLF